MELQTHRFFVKVYASNHHALRRLQKYDLDLFQATANVVAENRLAIDGLLTMEQIERLVLDGYQVLIEEEDRKRSRAHQEIMSFEEWLKERGN